MAVVLKCYSKSMAMFRFMKKEYAEWEFLPAE